MVDVEAIVSQLVVNGGNGRSKALEAIRAARNNEMERAEELLRESNESIVEAHHFQTELLQKSLSEEGDEVSLLLVHGQDHLMDAMVVKDLAAEMIEMYRMIHSKL